MRIELVDAEFAIGGHTIVKNINLVVDSCSTAIIRGKNAAGKSTLLNILRGSVRSTSGQCIVDGTPITDPTTSAARTIRKRIGFVQQSPSFHEHCSAFDNVLVAAAARGLDSTRATSEALEYFADFGISHVRSRVVAELSDWERRLVAAARAFVGSTSAIIIDQSFDGHDEASVRTMVDVVVRLCAGQRTLIATTTSENLDVILPHASVYELRDGCLTNISKLPSEEVQPQNGEPS